MDNAKEFTTTPRSFRRMGINLTRTSAYSPQTNGLSERINPTLLEKVRALLKRANLGVGYYGEAVVHAAYLHSRTVTTVLQGKTPNEV